MWLPYPSTPFFYQIRQLDGSSVKCLPKYPTKVILPGLKPGLSHMLTRRLSLIHTEQDKLCKTIVTKAASATHLNSSIFIYQYRKTVPKAQNFTSCFSCQSHLEH